MARKGDKKQAKKNASRKKARTDSYVFRVASALALSLCVALSLHDQNTL